MSDKVRIAQSTADGYALDWFGSAPSLGVVMKLQTVLIAAVTLTALSCAREEPPAPADEVQPASTVPEESQSWKTDAFIQHMHLHANQIDKLNMALAEGDFDGAMTPAYWLSRHDEVDGIPVELQQYIEGMRAAAREVEAASDFEAARAAAERITVQCQGCHSAADVDAGF